MGFSDTARAASIVTRQARAAAHTAAAMVLIREAQAAGASTHAEIARYLNACGSRTRLYCPWNSHRISFSLRQAERTQCP